MSYVTYILRSQTASKTYVGHTANLEKRLEEHNSGKSTYSKRYKPWKVIYIETFINELESIQREKYFKSSAGRRWMKKNLFNN